MLKNISWGDYFTAVVIALVVYYLFVGIRYYSDEIKDLLSGRKKINMKPAMHKSKIDGIANIPQPQITDTGFESITDDNFQETERLVEQLKIAITEGCRRELIPEEFKQSLIGILKEYPNIKYSPLRPSINEFILSECEKYQATALNNDEVELLWRV